MSLEELDKLERQRRDADQRYNDALTAFDAALVHAAPPATAGLVADSAVPPVPDGWRGWSVRAVQQWLSPWIDRQHAFNARTAEAIDALIARDRERSRRVRAVSGGADRVPPADHRVRGDQGSPPIAIAASRLDRQQRLLDDHAPALDAVPELRAQVAVLQRATAMLKRRVEESPAPPAAIAAAPSSAVTAPAASDSSDDYKYVGFEDQFRGVGRQRGEQARETTCRFSRARSDVVDLGCGRGEFLLALKSAGVTARGVDTNTDMVAVARERGLDVTAGDALGYVAGAGRRIDRRHHRDPGRRAPRARRT